MIKADCSWNIYYRFRPEAQGHGYASNPTPHAVRLIYADRDLTDDEVDMLRPKPDQ